MTDIKVGELKKIADEVCKINEEEFNKMLKFYHKLGVVIHYGDLVVFRAQWLAEQFKKLFDIPPYEKQVQCEE